MIAVWGWIKKTWLWNALALCGAAAIALAIVIRQAFNAGKEKERGRAALANQDKLRQAEMRARAIAENERIRAGQIVERNKQADRAHRKIDEQLQRDLERPLTADKLTGYEERMKKLFEEEP